MPLAGLAEFTGASNPPRAGWVATKPKDSQRASLSHLAAQSDSRGVASVRARPEPACQSTGIEPYVPEAFEPARPIPRPS